MTTIKQVALVAAVVLCVLVPAGAISAGAETISKEAAYKAATDTDPHMPLTAYQETMRAQKIQAATSGIASPIGKDGSASRVISGAAIATTSTPTSASLAQNQNPQKTSYWCGPASVNEALGQTGNWYTQEQLASELKTTTAGTAWSGGGTSPTGFPVPDVMNRHQSRNYYVPNVVRSTPSDSDVNYYKSALTYNIATVRAPIIGNAWTTKYSEFRLVGHPPATIQHWFDIYGYNISSGTTYTKYEDSVHGADSVGWSANVPAYSSLPSHQIAHIIGGRGYVW